ncbi:hypothetical protein DPMN_042175 [Dreissena polymorpha]|uniref:Uncharacterized protein n=1 Tax=Dreissena polymorpha TaxID=45954 RepID=A0A9D4HUJ3_DREPO|nr:hypothetical protein DPMN_042175 [Dreissena polymorpha]
MSCGDTDNQHCTSNWSQSGTSSNRHSLDSDLRSEEPNKFQSQYSLGKDSGRDSLTLEEENDCVTDGTSTAGYAGDTQSTITGDSISIGNPKTDFTQLDTEAWIKSLAVRAAQKEAESADKSSSLSRLTRQNILALDLMLAEASPKKKIDDESSVYSVDQEGFYTSFHNDSGLKRSTNTLIDEDEDDACLTPCKDTLSIGSEDSVIHRSALSDKFAGLRKGGNRKKVLSKVTPPLPPDRNLFDSNSQGFDNQTNKPELNSFPSVESSTESEEAVFTRVHDKTNLSHTGFPSLVALSTSDDESSPETKSAGLNSKGLESLVLQHTRSSLGLSNITCASNFSHVSLQSGSNLDDRIHSSPSLKHSSSVLECSKQGCDSPQTGRKEKSKVESSYQSWPRSHKSHTGILKSSEKSVESSRPCKTLNFDPVINLFKEGYQDAVQIPLPSPTNSSASESGRLSSFNLSEQSYSLAVPINERTKKKSNRQSDLPLKYQPVITVTPRSRSRSGDRKTFNSNVIADSSNTKSGQPQRPVIYATASKPRAQSTPQVLTNGSSTATTSAAPNLYAVSPVMAPREPCRQNSTSSKSSETSLYMDMQSLKSADSVDSLTSSECLNFNDTNNYMTMSSPSVSPNLSNMDFSITSTPSGSLDSLLDLRKTPTNELENDTYQINTNLHSSRSNGYMADFGNNKCVGDAKTIASSSYSSDNKQNIGASSSLKYTPGGRSVDSSDGDLTQVTQISMNSTMDGSRTPGSGNMMPGMQTRTPVSQHSASSEVSSAGNPSRQIGRRGSRADTRKEPSYRDLNAASRRSLPTDVAYHVRHVPLNDNKQGAPANQTHSPSMSSSKSFPLGFNSVLVSNSSYSSGQKGANNSSRPNVPQQSPSAYSQGDQFSSRSDSYRVAMGNGNQRTVSYRNAMHSSKSFPVLPPTTQSGPYRVAMDMNPSMAANNTYSYDDDVLNRADSYRMAVRNTNGIVSDVGNRNSALRVALHEDIPSHVNSKLEALGMEDSGLMSGRDVRRRGITDVDQVKNIKGKPAMKTSKSMPQMRTQDSKSPSAVVTRRKQEPTRQPAVTPETRPQSGRIRKVTTQDVDPIEIVQTVDTSVDSRKSAKNNPNRSSTYIQFDAIFEDGEDFTNPGDMDLSSLDYSKNLSSTSKSKIGLFNGTMKDANANNVKPTVFGTSKAGKNMEVEDNWRFSQV